LSQVLDLVQWLSELKDSLLIVRAVAEPWLGLLQISGMESHQASSATDQIVETVSLLEHPSRESSDPLHFDFTGILCKYVQRWRILFKLFGLRLKLSTLNQFKLI